MIPSQIPQYIYIGCVCVMILAWSLLEPRFTASKRLDQTLCLYRNRPTHAACQAVLVQYQPEIRLFEVVEIKRFVK